MPNCVGRKVRLVYLSILNKVINYKIAIDNESLIKYLKTSLY